AGAVLPDGRIVLLNSGTNQIRFYSPRGQMSEAQGMEGEGPGEYVFASRMFITRGDSVVVWDDALGRASVLSPLGDYARDLQPSAQLVSPRLAGVFADGSLLIVNATLDLKPGTSLQTQMGQDLHISAEGKVVDTLGAYPGRTAQLLKDG